MVERPCRYNRPYLVSVAVAQRSYCADMPELTSDLVVRYVPVHAGPPAGEPRPPTPRQILEGACLWDYVPPDWE
jgi:hypothetical protein